jgi:hypothetical protein
MTVVGVVTHVTAVGVDRVGVDGRVLRHCEVG